MRATTNGELAALKHALTAAEKRFRAHDAKLRDALTHLEKSTGKDTRPVLAELRTFHAVVETEIHRLGEHKLHTPGAHHARSLAVAALTALAASLATLRRSFAARDKRTATHALHQSQHDLERGRALTAQASDALGFKWRP